MIRTAHFMIVALAALLFPAAHTLADQAVAQPQVSLSEDGHVKTSLSLDKTEARVADPIELRLEVETPPKTHVVLPKIEKQLGAFDVRSSEVFSDIPSGNAAGSRLSVLRLKLDTIKTGDLTIPPLDVHYSADGDSAQPKTVSTKALAIHITSLLEDRADPTKFRDIKQTVDVAVPEPVSYEWLGWTAAGAGTALAAGLLLVALRRRRGPTPAAWALASIDDVAKLNIETAADAQAVVNEIVDIIREYFGLEFNVPALSRTSRELVSQAKRRFRLSESAVESLAWLVSLADEIKFARLGSGEKQVREAINRARAFVNECERGRLAHEKGAA